MWRHLEEGCGRKHLNNKVYNVLNVYNVKQCLVFRCCGVVVSFVFVINVTNVSNVINRIA